MGMVRIRWEKWMSGGLHSRKVTDYADAGNSFAQQIASNFGEFE